MLHYWGCISPNNTSLRGDDISKRWCNAVWDIGVARTCAPSGGARARAWGTSRRTHVAPGPSSRCRWIPKASFAALWSGPFCTVSEELHFSALAEGAPSFRDNHSSQQIAEYMKSVPYRPDDVDPRTSLVALSIPTLWLFGGKDNSIPVDLSVERLRNLFQKGHSNFQYKVFPEYGHNLADSPKQVSYQYMIGWLKNVASSMRRTGAQQSVPGDAPASRERP